MEQREYNTFAFFRRYFGLPRRSALEWCVVKESTREGTQLRLGVRLKGTNLYIDVAMRRFFHEVDIPLIRRRCFPARRIGRPGEYEYRTGEGWGISKPKSYVRDIYYNSVFSKELLKTRLM